MSDVDVLVHEEGNLLVQYRSALIQVRSGEMTPRVLDRLESASRLARASFAGNVGAVTIIEDGAPLGSAPMRAKQAALIKSLLRDPRTYLVSTVIGDSVVTRSIQTVMRLLLIGVPRIRVTRTIDEAADWLSEKLGTVTPTELKTAIGRARAILREGRPTSSPS